MKATLNNAVKMAKAIQANYNKLNLDDENFFNLYHDDLLCQSNCAWEAVDEFEYYLEKGEQEFAEEIFQQIKDTLKYVSYIIKIQDLLGKCPKSIYG